MKSRTIIEVMLLGVLALISSGATTRQSSSDQAEGAQSPIRVQSNLVDLPVLVTDRRGNFVENLKEQNFHIFDQGSPQTIALFEPRDMPVTVGLVVDHSGSMASKLPEVSAASEAFVKSSNPQDQLFVVNFNEIVTLALPAAVSFTDDPKELEAAIGASHARGQTALYDAVIDALDHLRHSKQERQALILVTDGGDNASKHNFRDVLGAAMKSKAIIYCIGIYDESDPDAKPRQLEKLAKVTGGEAYFPQDVMDVTGIIRNIAEILRKDYMLGFVPSLHGAPATWHSVRVVVSTPSKEKVIVHTRAGYQSSADATQQSAGNP